jgi:O-antigen biosynthesis protein WbqV
MRCITVRFGNVLGSRGSVLSIFQEQLAKRGQLSISHRDATRFFLTVLEATTLILQAVLLGRHRDLVVIEMGEPIRILDLARRFLRLRGIQEADVTFTIEELKPGEKLHEELFYSEEEKFPTACTNITRASGKALNAVTLDTELCELEKALFQLSDLELRTRIRRIVPQYTFHGFAEQQSNLEGALVPASCWSVA